MLLCIEDILRGEPTRFTDLRDIYRIVRNLVVRYLQLFLRYESIRHKKGSVGRSLVGVMTSSILTPAQAASSDDADNNKAPFCGM